MSLDLGRLRTDGSLVRLGGSQAERIEGVVLTSRKRGEHPPRREVFTEK